MGPYELHDFFLFYFLRYGFGPRKIYMLACKAFGNQAATKDQPNAGRVLATHYDEETIAHWMQVFFRRFFSQQFKRSCLPDGPKVGSVSLSPRGDWRMPSDAVSTMWLREVENLGKKTK
ncbi:Glutamine-dependent NAD(+) synthetase [Chlamydia trachomatis]|nr:Glutamine-dependent NAD(+) synthetase [Chlamydia trachomatis]